MPERFNYKEEDEIEDENKDRDCQNNISIKETRNKNNEEMLNQEGIKIKNKNKNKTRIKKGEETEIRSYVDGTEPEDKDKNHQHNLAIEEISDENNKEILNQRKNRKEIKNKNNYEKKNKELNSNSLGEANYQTSSEETNSRTSEGNFETSTENPSSVNCEGGSYQTSLHNSTPSYFKKESNSSSPLDIEFPEIELFSKNNDNELEISLKNLFEEVQKQTRKNKKLKPKGLQRNKPSSKISTSLLNKSQEIIDKFMRKRKSKHKENRQPDIANSKCLVVTEGKMKDRLIEIIESLRLEHLNGGRREKA